MIPRLREREKVMSFVIEEYGHPVEKYSKHMRGDKTLAVFLDDEFLIVVTEDFQMMRHLKREYATELIEDFDAFSSMVAEIYFSGWYSVRDIAYEKVGEPLVPLWLRFLHSLGLTYN
jgi:hypothetical protein